MIRALAAAALLAPCAVPLPALDTGGGLGPLRIPSQSPGQSLRLGLVPRTPSDLAAGQWEAFAGATWANVWAYKPEYQLDYEVLSQELMLAHAPATGWRLEGALIVRTTFGGAMDGFIQGFHDAFNLGQGGRDQVPRGRTVIRIAPTASQPGVLLADDDLEGVSEVHARLTVQRHLLCCSARWPSLAVAATVQAPLTASDAYAGGDLDAALDAIAAQRLGRLHAYATLTCTRYGAERIHGVRVHRSVWSGLAALEGRLGARWSLVLQYLASQGIAPDYHVFSRPSHELTGGFKVRLGERAVAEVGALENLVTFDNSPDFGVHAALRVRW